MIPRYSRPEMARIWSQEAKYDAWLKVELAVCEVYARRGIIPADALGRIKAAARVSAPQIDEIETKTRHDVIAFLSMLAESVGDESRQLHVGLTSSDLVDTALAGLIAEAGQLLATEVRALRQAAWSLAERHRRTPMVGRTHGIHAEPITFGLKCLGWSEELGRDLDRLEAALVECAVGKFSGAVGTLAHLDPALEEAALARLNLRPEPVATQVVQRDRHAALLCALAVLAGSFERIAVELRHLQRTEVREAEEPFAEGQKGSSAMPHKRNPVRSERVSGLARLVRGYAQAALENQPLWHERDISHSSVERVILPDAFLLADFMAAELREILAGLRVHAEAMRRNLEAGGGLVFSQRVLLALIRAGLARDEAYRIVQEHALAALDRGLPFRGPLESDRRVTAALSPEALSGCFTLEPALRHVDALFARAERPQP